MIRPRAQDVCARMLYAVFLAVLISCAPAWGQEIDADRSAAAPQASPSPQASPTPETDLITKKIAVDGGAELVTIFARRNTDKADPGRKEVPLVSVLRDTLGDDDPENDRVRYVWTLTHPKPSLDQKMMASIPFLYTRTADKDSAGSHPPPPVIDLGASYKGQFEKIAKFGINTFFLRTIRWGIRAPIRQYQTNRGNYRDASLATASTVLEYYDRTGRSGDGLSQREVSDIQARSSVAGAIFGWHLPADKLETADLKQIEHERDIRSHNWELLRQYADRQGLYFEPLTMPDGTQRMAILWTAEEDVKENRGRKFEKRFLNISNPWRDRRLENWKGYSEMRWYGPDRSRVDEAAPGAVSRRMIPLAVYGLDHPKIPILLIDFRNKANPKFREMSGRFINDMIGFGRSFIDLSWIPVVLGRRSLNFLTGRRGMDINQSSRVRSYAQLKVFLTLDNSLDPRLSRQMIDLIENSSINPLENGLDTQLVIAQQQYENLIAFAKRPDGLPALIARDRREELVGIKKSAGKRMWLSALHFISFGNYTYREKPGPDTISTLAQRRKLDFHERRIRELGLKTVMPEIDSNIEAIRESVDQIASSGGSVGGKTAEALSRIYSATRDAELRTMCLTALYNVESPASKSRLLAIYTSPNTSDEDKLRSAQYLKQALNEGKKIAARDARAIEAIGQ